MGRIRIVKSGKYYAIEKGWIFKSYKGLYSLSNWFKKSDCSDKSQFINLCCTDNFTSIAEMYNHLVTREEPLVFTPVPDINVLTNTEWKD